MHQVVLAMRLWVGAMVLPLCFGTAYVAAENGAAISQGFETTETNLVAGALMSLSAESGNTVGLANSDNVEELIGVLGDKSLIALDSSGSKQVQVVTSGLTLAMISNINGDIKTGDKITASPISGVGMKATKSAIIIGTAQANMADIQTKEATIQSADQASQTVKIGAIPVQVNVTFYETPEDRTTALPLFLHDFASNVAGKQVSPVRIILAGLILLLSLLSIAVLLYSAVQSSIISIGRNPLSEAAVHKSLWQVGGIIFGILLLTVIAIYLILIT
ncbi:MAG TPA: hypothetical protein VFT87_04685 [Candidatus Saccharimonadales bacterium]|nr:hypothetical protein [Candidatus Saccharimonadales bacterium]